ncbi:MAG: sensor histidine kinase [Candidatus Dormibacteraeota bacterium]|nr:sensor histidine kinase [Candidatus Dormibacteraeota bacterium]
MRDLTAAAGVSWARFVGAVVLVLVAVIGTLGSDRGNPHGALRQLDLLGGCLVGLAAAAWLLSARWPLRAYAVSAGATLTYVALGYTVASPFFLGLVFTTSAAVVWDRPLRSVGLLLGGAAWPLVSALVYAVHGSHPLVPLAVAAWPLLPIGAGHLVSHRAWQLREAAAADRDREMRARIAEERLRIARELHDVVSHTVSVISVHAGAASHVIDDRPEDAKRALKLIRAASSEAMGELRTILGVLRDPESPDSLQPAPRIESLPDLVETAKSADLAVELRTVGQVVPLPTDVGLAAYRVVQEALTNVVKHSRARRVSVCVEYGQKELSLEVADDGRGAPAGERRPGGGHGLVGMRERLRSVGGTLDARPRPEGGFMVRATIPLTAAR